MIKIKIRHKLGRLAPHRPVYLQTAPLSPLKVSKFKIYRISIEKPPVRKTTFGMVIRIKMLPERFFRFTLPVIREKLPNFSHYQLHSYSLPFAFEGETRAIEFAFFRDALDAIFAKEIAFALSTPSFENMRRILIQPSRGFRVDLRIDESERPRPVDLTSQDEVRSQNLDFYFESNIRSSNLDFIIPPETNFLALDFGFDARKISIIQKYKPAFQMGKRPKKILIGFRLRKKPKPFKFSFPASQVAVTGAEALRKPQIRTRNAMRETAFPKIEVKRKDFVIESSIVGQTVDTIPKAKIRTMGTNALIVYSKKKDEQQPASDMTVVD